MRSASANRRMSPLSVVAFAFITLIIGAFGTVGSLWAMGVDLPFFKKPVPRPTGVPVPLSSRHVAAYTKVSRDDLFSAKTLAPTVIYLPADQVKMNNFITDPTKVLGRVLKREKMEGYAFVEDDFCPDNTRPGVVAGVPPGKRMFVLSSDKISGIQLLKAGDRFDLIATTPIDHKSGPARNLAGLQKALTAAEMAGDQPPARASMQVLVQNGSIVVPCSVREVPTNTPHTKGREPPTKPVQEIVIAVDPAELAPLTEALVMHAEILCAARSGIPTDSAAEDKTPNSTPPPPVRAVEVITGAKRELLAFPRTGTGPAQQPAAPGDTAKDTKPGT